MVTVAADFGNGQRKWVLKRYWKFGTSSFLGNQDSLANKVIRLLAE
jgi:hypothetical protein